MSGFIAKFRSRHIGKTTRKMTGRISRSFRRKLLKRPNHKRHYGLIGHPLSHTLSPVIHKNIMKQCGIRGTYKSFDISPDDFDVRALEILEKLDGFNITIPYKERIVHLLDTLDENALDFGAVNTVSCRKGYNTDIYGFRACNIDFKDKRVLLLGNGGVARIMLPQALSGGSNEICICARDAVKTSKLISDTCRNKNNNTNDKTIADIDTNADNRTIENTSTKTGINTNSSNNNVNNNCTNNNTNTNINKCTVYHADFRDLTGVYDVILNATPLGMWPHCNEIPVSEDIIKTAKYVFDSIYNPLATRLLLKAREYGVRADNGLVMLLQQALFAQQIWNDKADFSAFDMSRILPRMRKKLFKHFPVKIVLTGFMGSGKTTIGKKLAKAMGIGFADLDLLIVEENRKPISAIFKDSGEEFFRESEKKCLARIMKEPASLVVSTGGGALISPDNAAIVKENQGFVFYLSTDLATSLKRVGDNQDRPLISGKDREHIEFLYNKRLPIYKSISDFTVDATGNPDEILNTILEAIGYQYS